MLEERLAILVGLLVPLTCNIFCCVDFESHIFYSQNDSSRYVTFVVGFIPVWSPLQYSIYSHYKQREQ